jgi:hypothetical protein
MSPKLHTGQQGVALLVFVIAIALGALAYLISDLTIDDIRIQQVEKTQQVLHQAKRALIAYALTDSDVSGTPGKIGKLPCPDVIAGGIDEGFEDATCGVADVNGIGYFPWKSVGLDVLKDTSGTCLLYAVSPSYKNNPNLALNPDIYGQFQIVDSNGAVIQGVTPEDRPVAIVFAPGSVLTGQNRNYDNTTDCNADYNNVAAYLDDDGVTNNAAIPAGANIIDVLVQKYAGSEQAVNPLNDRFVTITHDEIWTPLVGKLRRADFDNNTVNNKMRELTEALAVCLAGYGLNNSDRLPMPVPLDLDGGDYRVDVDYDDDEVVNSEYSGRFPYDVKRANDAIGTTDDDHLFNNTYCTNLNLPTAGVAGINLKDSSGSDNGEYRRLWQNWKDHFFYSLSKDFNPGASSPSCGDCVEVAADDYAAIVFYAGFKQGAQQRYAPPFDGALALDGVDDKDDVSNYLENGNDSNFPDNNGDKVYSVVDTANSNDVMFCIKEDMSVVECL